MVNCVVRDWQGAESGQASFDLKTANEENAPHIVHRALIRQLANVRQGNASTKTRAEVRGGGRKPWRQKGTGRARAGSIRSPLWRGGGVSFGPKPRDYTIKMNKKERRLALTTALLSRAEDLIVVADFAAHLPQPKTKELLAAMVRWGIVGQKDETVYRSARNIAKVKLILANNLNVFDILAADRVLVTESAIAKIQEVFGE
jgi:large subunit ribosomal protein L4